VSSAVKGKMPAMTKSSLTRRDFMEKLAFVCAALGAGAISGGPFSFEPRAASCERRAAVVSFHMDQPYLDTTGTAMPYHPPRGARSAAPVAHLTEEAFRRKHCYV